MIGLLLVAQLAVAAHGPDTASACVPIELSVAARAPGIVAPRVEPLRARGLQLLRSSVVSRIERDGFGRPSTLTEATLVVATAAVGRIVVPPIQVTLGTQRAAASPITIDVRPSGPLAPQVLVRALLDRGGSVRTDTIFVGQQVDYVVDVQLNEPARQRLRRNPTFFPPEMPAVLAYDLAPPPTIERDGRRCFETLSYRRALFPLFPGAAAIPPAALTYSLPLSTSFFSREETYELHTDSVRFVAIDVPASGRPTDYAGAVGSLRATASIESPNARMGDPIVLTVRLDGRGNVKLLPRPTLSVDWATVALGEERVRLDTAQTRVQGSKEFDWLLTPRRAGPQTVPAVRYPFFDPDSGAYDVTVTAPLTIDVAAAALAAADSAVAARLALRPALGPERAPLIPSRPWYWALLALAPGPAVFRRLRRLRRQRSAGITAARRLNSLAGSRTPPQPRELRRLFLDALAERVPAVREGAPRPPLARTLRRAGVTEATAVRAEELLTQLDTAAFSTWGAIDPRHALAAQALYAAVDKEAVKRASFHLSAGTSAMAIALVWVLLSGRLLALPDALTQSFSAGVHAYDRGDFVGAERQFARVVLRAPRAADAWANYGTAAWAAGDSAVAARGWQRALRLDPLDEETRSRLSLVQPVSLRAPAYVAPVPVDAVALVALVLWVGAWLAIAVPPSRRPAATRSVAGAAIALGVLALVATLELRDRVEARGLGVVRSTGSLRDTPSGSGARVAVVGAGETGALGAREGLWVRVTLDAGRAGWLPATSVLPLD
jgi:hypothetical protein